MSISFCFKVFHFWIANVGMGYILLFVLLFTFTIRFGRGSFVESQKIITQTVEESGNDWSMLRFLLLLPSRLYPLVHLSPLLPRVSCPLSTLFILSTLSILSLSSRYKLALISMFV